MPEIVLDHRQVTEILPHRAPMLLIDEVISLEPMRRIEARLVLRPEWEVFKGHFPGSPIFPGVLSVECMAQAADIMIMTGERYAGLTPLFVAIDHVRFLKSLLPGDVVTARAEVAEVNEAKAKIVARAELCREDGEIAATAEITVAMR